MLAKLHDFTRGLHFKLLMLVLGVATALFAAQLVTDTAREYRKIRQDRVSDALSITGVLARSLERNFVDAASTELERMLAQIRIRADVGGVALVDRDLTFLLDGDSATAPVAAPLPSDTQLRSLRTGRTEYDAGRDGIEVSEPLLEGSKTIGSVAVTFLYPPLSEALWPILLAKATAMIPVLAVGLLFALALASQIIGPLSRLGGAMRAFSDGDLDRKVPLEGAREIRQLGEAFARMIEKLKASIDQIYELAYIDRITRLPNREYFRMELTRAIKRAQRTDSAGALLFVDLDGFKRVNDTLGHDIGDRLLRAFSDRVSKIIRANDTITWQSRREAISPDGNEGRNDDSDKQVLARLGGDEFTILLAEISEETDAATVARRIIKAMREPFVLGGTELRLGASVGIATFPRDGSDYQAILKSADMAMYQAKDEGKNTFRFFSEELNNRVSKRMEIESDLRRALAGDELELYFQPKVDCRTGQPISVEALVRWHHPEKGLVNPGEFIGVAEKSGLIRPLGKWVLKRACDQIREFERIGLDIAVAVNISMQQFERPDFASKVLAIVLSRGIKPHHLELEITEAMAMSDPQRALDHLRRLKRAGVRFAIDDFGTGHSNLSQLSRLPFDVLKIDMSFVESITDETDNHGRRIVQAILALARSLNCETVAEGVETEEQRVFLADAGCSHAQGYLFGRPVPAREITQWLSEVGRCKTSRKQPAA